MEYRVPGGPTGYENMPLKEKEKLLGFCTQFDPRYPHTNQTRHCTQSFIDYYRCKKLRGDKYEPCTYFKKVFEDICPSEWTERWHEQMEKGTFPVKL